MQDRFKFRVWNKLSNIMTYNFMFGNFMQKSLKDYEKKDWVGLNYEPDYICFNNKGIEDNLVIMQCTGLKDKNGKLIYEGDILKGKKNMIYSPYSSRMVDKAGVVEIPQNMFVASCRDVKNNCTLFCQIDWVKTEVIGNIYENPELLEVE